MKTFTIYSLRVADALVNKGFKLIRTGINFNNPQFKVFYFEDTPELQEAVAMLLNK